MGRTPSFEERLAGAIEEFERAGEALDELLARSTMTRSDLARAGAGDHLLDPRSRALLERAIREADLEPEDAPAPAAPIDVPAFAVPV
jgi:hypothetical protein